MNFADRKKYYRVPNQFNYNINDQIIIENYVFFSPHKTSTINILQNH